MRNDTCTDYNKIAFVLSFDSLKRKESFVVYVEMSMNYVDVLLHLSYEISIFT